MDQYTVWIYPLCYWGSMDQYTVWNCTVCYRGSLDRHTVWNCTMCYQDHWINTQSESARCAIGDKWLIHSLNLHDVLSWIICPIRSEYARSATIQGLVDQYTLRICPMSCRGKSMFISASKWLASRKIWSVDLWNTTCGHKAKDITPSIAWRREAWKEEALDIFLERMTEKEPTSVRPTLEVTNSVFFKFF